MSGIPFESSSSILHSGTDTHSHTTTGLHRRKQEVCSVLLIPEENWKSNNIATSLSKTAQLFGICRQILFAELR